MNSVYFDTDSLKELVKISKTELRETFKSEDAFHNFLYGTLQERISNNIIMCPGRHCGYTYAEYKRRLNKKYGNDNP